MNQIFIYYKSGKIKVLDLEDATQNDKLLKIDGWDHTATLDPCRFIEHLYNESEEVDVYATVKELTNKP